MRTLLSLVFVFALTTDVTAKPSVEDFFKNFTYTQMSISPSGRYLGALAPSKDRRNIAVIDLEDPSKSGFATGLTKQDIVGFQWATDDRLVFSIDDEGNESFGLYAVDRDGKSGITTLVDPAEGRSSGLASAFVLDLLPDEPERILVAFDDRILGAPDVFMADLDPPQGTRGSRVKKGRRVVARNPGDVNQWITDHAGQVRVAVAQDGLYTEIRYRDSEESEWIVIERNKFGESGISPLAFDYDNETMFVSTDQGRNTAAVYRYNPKTRELGEMVFGHDEVDHGSLMMSDAKKKLIGVTYMTDKPRHHFLDEEMEHLYTGLEQAFPDLMTQATSSTRDEMKWIVSTGSDRDPGSYYLLDREAGGLKFLAHRADWIKAEEMVPMKPVEFAARDGLTLRGYLTLPQGQQKSLPLIVNPHGGPYGVRDAWSFNREHQFFASRGWATLQVNFRGSGGYGRKFEEAGYKQWGRSMQNDISDAVNWAVEQGFADPDRVCIYGASYGGYATMAGMTMTPDLYKCGVNYVGVTDVPLLFETMPKAWEPLRPVMAQQIGDPETEREMLEAVSPINHVDKIQAPIFIVHGRRDPRVVMAHADRLRAEMEKHDKEYEWLVKNDEGHGFRKEENNIELYTQMEEFLGRHLNVN